MHAHRWRTAFAALPLLIVAGTAVAKPVTFAGGTTVMGEYGAGAMTEVQVFYSPSFRYSVGGGHLTLDGEQNDSGQQLDYLRINFLPKRWNLDDAQANAFVWGGGGRAHDRVSGDNHFAWNAGGQLDIETRRLYASLRTDLHESDAFSQRSDTLQLGIAPYEHEYDGLALWFVIQGRQHAGDLSDGTEWAALVRLFKRNAWIEAGVTQDGKPQAMLMFTF